MSDVLCLIDHLLERSRRLAAAAQHAAAVELLRDVETFRLSPVRAEEVQRLLAESYLAQRRFRKAHRHLAKAVRLAPRTARYHYLLGVCVASHKHGRVGRALAHFRRSLHLSPSQPVCRAEAGLLTVRLGRIEAGLRLLRRAAEGNPSLTDKLVRGLCDAGRPDDARRAVQAAQFAAPRCPKLRQLSADLQTGRIVGEQQRQRASGAVPVLLPFVSLRRAT